MKLLDPKPETVQIKASYYTIDMGYIQSWPLGSGQFTIYTRGLGKTANKKMNIHTKSKY